MFGSDWPVCLLAASYERVFEATRHTLGDLGASDCAAVFGGTATEIYRPQARQGGARQMSRIVELDVIDVRFPTSRSLDGSDAMNPDPDYSAAYVILRDDAGDGLEGHGLTFTIGRGTEVVVAAVTALRPLVLGRFERGAVRGHGRVLALARRRQPASLDRTREGRHPSDHGRGGERGLQMRPDSLARYQFPDGAEVA